MKRNIMHYPVGTLARDGSGIYYFLGTAYRAAHDERDARRRERAVLDAAVDQILARAVYNRVKLSREEAERCYEIAEMSRSIRSSLAGCEP